jgi:hypothetical protein
MAGTDTQTLGNRPVIAQQNPTNPAESHQNACHRSGDGNFHQQCDQMLLGKHLLSSFSEQSGQNFIIKSQPSCGRIRFLA